MNLKPCPCGKTPTKVYNIEGNLYGECCGRWGVHCYALEDWTAAWDAAPRSVPAVCPQCEGEGVVTDVERFKNGGEWPCIPCPTCEPFGGRGAIMVEAGEQQPEGEG